MTKLEKILKHGDICVLILLICNCFILLGDPLGNDTMVSIGSRIMLLTVCLYGGIGLVKIFRTKKVIAADFFLVLFLLFSLISTISEGMSGLINNIIPFICFLMFSFCVLTYRNMLNTNKVKLWIYVGNFLYFFIYVYLYSSPLKYIKYSEYGASIGDDLTLGYQNPNQTGLQLFVTFIIMLSLFDVTHKLVIKVSAGVSSAFVVYMIYQTGSRMCIVLTGIVLIMYFTKQIKKINENTISIAFWIPVIMWLMLYIGAAYGIELEFLGDEFDTGRTIIFHKIINDMDIYSLFLGKFSAYCSENFHNSYFTVLATFGILVLIFYLFYLKVSYQYYYRCLQSAEKKDYVAFAGMLGIIAHGAVEATFLVSGMVYASLASLLFVLVQDKGDNV